MRLFLAYIRQRRKGILAFFLFCLIFGVSFCLYRLPLQAVVYPSMLCILLGGVFVSVDLFHVKQKHMYLQRLRDLDAAMLESLPEIESVEDEDYQALIQTLREEMEKAAAADSARFQDMSEYYTVWVHQIKTPITSMRLTLEKEDTALSRKLSSDLFQIEQYVEMVLAFLRIDSDSSDHVFQEYELDEIVGQALAKFAPEFIARGIHLERTPTGRTVITDEKWLSFVIEQVLSNALKYTPEGKIKIYMREPMLLCIEDTGIGIAAADLPRVFEKGYTGYNGRKDKRASGIGLYLCKRICNRLGAEIRIDSEPDKGTVVMIDLEQYRSEKE